MSKSEPFDLYKIKKLTQPIQVLENNLSRSLTLSSKFEEIKKDFHSYDIESKGGQYNQLFTDIELLTNQIERISIQNINSLLTFQKKLFKKYKIQYKKIIIKSNLNKAKIKNIGLNLIKGRKISKILETISYISSIKVEEWMDLIESLKENSLFQNSIKNVKSYHDQIIKRRLNRELETIQQEIDPKVIENFKKAFLNDPTISFNNFLEDIKHVLSDKALMKRKEILQRTKKKEELESYKKKQQEQSQVYEDYLKLSPQEFEKRRRKKKREKLSEITPSKTPSEQLKISDEISEKIEKFKSKFDKKFQNDYPKDDADQQDPLELIRSRKKKKSEEFKKYKNHFNTQ